jgi:hypothetical protein
LVETPGLRASSTRKLSPEGARRVDLGMCLVVGEPTARTSGSLERR